MHRRKINDDSYLALMLRGIRQYSQSQAGLLMYYCYNALLSGVRLLLLRDLLRGSSYLSVCIFAALCL